MKLIKTYFSYLGIAYFVGGPLYYMVGVGEIWLWPLFTLLAFGATYFHYFPLYERKSTEHAARAAGRKAVRGLADSTGVCLAESNPRSTGAADDRANV